MVSGCFVFVCRHTGRIECANSLSLVYTPKQCTYRFVMQYCSWLKSYLLDSFYYVKACETRKI